MVMLLKLLGFGLCVYASRLYTHITPGDRLLIGNGKYNSYSFGISFRFMWILHKEFNVTIYADGRIELVEGGVNYYLTDGDKAFLKKYSLLVLQQDFHDRRPSRLESGLLQMLERQVYRN